MYALVFQEYMDRILTAVSDEFDKRETSLIYQSIAMIIPELISLEFDINSAEYEAFPDTASMENLMKFARLRGIEPRPATQGIVLGEFNRELPEGTRLYCEGLYYRILNLKSQSGDPPTYVYRLECESTGMIETIGDLIPVEDIARLEKAKIIDVEKDGTETEDVESLRQRYFDSLNFQRFGGNRADYVELVMRLPNIGAVKAYRRTNTADVTVVIVDEKFHAASSELINRVQKYLDPDNSLDGVGMAPIGHRVLVKTAEEQAINVRVKISYEPNTDIEPIKKDIENIIKEFVEEQKQNWAKNEAIILRLAHLETKILNIGGVIDVSGTQFNGREQNLTIEDMKLPKVGDINVSRA